MNDPAEIQLQNQIDELSQQILEEESLIDQAENIIDATIHEMDKNIIDHLLYPTWLIRGKSKSN